MTPRWRWRKLSSALQEDLWWERLAAVRERVAVTALAGSRTIRLEAFALSRREAEGLQAAFGGQIAPESAANPAPAAAPRRPLRIRGKLIVAGSEEELHRAQGKSKALGLIIPAGMAFGTGDHATTAGCLRFLVDLAPGFGTQPWDFLDLGCGTGILALAAARLGARKVEACDFDPVAVRTALANASANGISRLKVLRRDVRTWKPGRPWSVLAANLFSDVLVEIAPKLAAATVPGGSVIFSGVLRSQEKEVVAALRAAGLRMKEVTCRGKWVAGLARRPL